MRTNGKCRFYLYDPLGREVISGLCSYYTRYEDGLNQKTVTAQRTNSIGWMNIGYTFTDISLRNIQLYIVKHQVRYITAGEPVLMVIKFCCAETILVKTVITNSKMCFFIFLSFY